MELNLDFSEDFCLNRRTFLIKNTKTNRKINCDVKKYLLLHILNEQYLKETSEEKKDEIVNIIKNLTSSPDKIVIKANDGIFSVRITIILIQMLMFFGSINYLL